MSSWVNPKIVVGDAGPKGRGLFAKEKIKKGEIVAIANGRIIHVPFFAPSPPDVSSDLWFNHCFAIEKEFAICPVDLVADSRDGVFMLNHSCDPNCGLSGQIAFVAMRDVGIREELTYDYVMTDGSFYGVGGGEIKSMKCSCGSVNCRKFYTGDDWRRKDLQEKYKGYFSPYIQEMIDELNSKSEIRNKFKYLDSK